MRIKKIITLIKTLLKSGSYINQLRYVKDNTKKRRIIFNLIAYIIVFAYMLALAFFMGIGYIELGIGEYLPSLSIIAVCSMAFILTFFKADSYLVNFKSKYTLLSLPFTTKEIVFSRFMYMYINSLSLQMVFVAGFIAAYIWFLKPSLLFVSGWVILGLILPIVPAAISSFAGMFIGKITARFKFKKAMRLLFSLVFCSLVMFSSFFFGQFSAEEDMLSVLANLSVKINGFIDLFAPAKLVSNILYHGDILSILIVAVSVLLSLYIFIEFTTRAYSRISNNSDSIIRHKKQIFHFKKKSLISTIAYKEFKRFAGSNNYIMNAGFGLIIAIILSFVSIVAGGEKLVLMIAGDISLPNKLIVTIIPFAVYLFTGMISTTCISPSLEGKNFWIVQSLPISKKNLYLGKMLFNIELMLPTSLISVVLLDLSFNASLIEIITTVIFETVLILFSTLFGLILGDKLIKLEFDNEIEVIKQSAAVFVYMFSNMILTIVIAAITVNFSLTSALGFVLWIPFVIYSLLCAISYVAIKKFCW